MKSMNYPELNIQDSKTLSPLQAKSIDFAYQFGKDMRDFINVLGIMTEQPVTEGYTIKTKVADAEVDLQDGNVPEGEIIPLSKVTFKDATPVEIDSKFWRKNTTYQAIQRFGQENAIDRTDAEIVDRIKSDIRKEMFAFMSDEATPVESVRKGSLQGAVAGAWGALEKLFESANETVVFANPMDIARYLGEAQVTTQVAFGVTYLDAFTGTRILASNQVPEGTILATVPRNLHLFYIPAASEGGNAFEMISDDTGFIGLTRGMRTENASIDTLFTSGIKIVPEIANGIVKVAIGQKAPTV